MWDGSVKSSPPQKPRPAVVLPHMGNPRPARKPFCKEAATFTPGGLQSPLPWPATGTMLKGRIWPVDTPGVELVAPGIGAAPGLTYCTNRKQVNRAFLYNHAAKILELYIQNHKTIFVKSAEKNHNWTT